MHIGGDDVALPDALGMVESVADATGDCAKWSYVWATKRRAFGITVSI